MEVELFPPHLLQHLWFYDIGDEEYVLLLTELGNEHNWFTAGDPLGRKNLFVHTAFWEQFHQSEQRYADLESYLHQTKVIQQVLAVIEGIREQMLFKSRFNFTDKPPRLFVQKGGSRKIYFPDLGNLELRLTPLQKTVYLFFLMHPEGVVRSNISDYRDEIYGLYSSLYTGSDLCAVNNSVDVLCNPLDNSMNEKISTIKKKINNTLGPDIAKSFLIQGTNSQAKRIPVDRRFVEFEEH